MFMWPSSSVACILFQCTIWFLEDDILVHRCQIVIDQMTNGIDCKSLNFCDKVWLISCKFYVTKSTYFLHIVHIVTYRIICWNGYVLELAIDSSLLHIFIRFMYFREQHKYPMRTFLSVLIWFGDNSWNVPFQWLYFNSFCTVSLIAAKKTRKHFTDYDLEVKSWVQLSAFLEWDIWVACIEVSFCQLLWVQNLPALGRKTEKNKEVALFMSSFSS